MNIEIWTDGACSGNPGPGAWAALILFENGAKKMISGSVPTSTNNAMEIQAAQRALQIIRGEGHNIVIFTDSKYLEKGIMEWMDLWQRRRWKKASGDIIANDILWKKIKRVCDKNNVTAEWVRGHSGHKNNEIVNSVARIMVGLEKDDGG